MKKMLHPDQLVALKDYPIRHTKILRIYYQVFSEGKGKAVSPCPVIPKPQGVLYLRSKDKRFKPYNAELEKFMKSHPKARYFLLDGNHRSIAAALAHRSMPALILRTDSDIKKARKMLKAGELPGTYSISNSVKSEIAILARHYAKHFQQRPAFYTVAEKAELLVKNGKIPRYITEEYRKNKSDQGREDQRQLALWAADCAEHVLPYFEKEYPKDDRPRKAIEECRTWARSGLPMRMKVIRGASLSAHAAARKAKDDGNDASCFAARAAGQAVATAHVPQHAYGAPYYAIKAVAAADPAHAEARIAKEFDWQSRHIPKDLMKGWREWQSRRLPKDLRQVLKSMMKLVFLEN